jgi:hypothetical protein
MTIVSPSSTTYPVHDIPTDLVPVVTREGRTIMVSRQTAEGIASSWDAINRLTNNMLMQREQFEQQNRDVEELNNRVKKITSDDVSMYVTVLRNVRGIIHGIALFVIFAKDQACVACSYASRIPSICYQAMPETSVRMKCLICTVLACGAVFVLMSMR